MLDTLKKLTSLIAPSGHENNIADFISGALSGVVDEMRTDALGNLIAHKKGTGKKLMFAAHMDEIGVIVTFIDENGFLRFSALGGVSPMCAVGQRVMFQNGTVGVIGTDGKADPKTPKLSSLFIDIGASSREAAEKAVQIGDVAGFSGGFEILGDRIVSRCLDDRAGCAVLMETAKHLKDSLCDLYYVFTVQEELGLRGAGPAAFGIAPDYAVAIDVTRTGDIPDATPFAVSLGKGPAIKIKDHSVLAHPSVKRAMIAAAEQLALPYQLEVLENGGTDTGAIHLSGGGVPSGCISIPTRYIHTPAEMVSIADLENCVKLAAGITEQLH